MEAWRRGCGEEPAPDNLSRSLWFVLWDEDLRDYVKIHQNRDFFFDLQPSIEDTICSRPAKPLPSGMLKCGGFFYGSGEPVEYSKPALTFEQQADLLRFRGLIAERAGKRDGVRSLFPACENRFVPGAAVSVGGSWCGVPPHRATGHKTRVTAAPGRPTLPASAPSRRKNLVPPGLPARRTRSIMGLVGGSEYWLVRAEWRNNCRLWLSHENSEGDPSIVRQVVIENPVINSPFREPGRHSRLTDEGITSEIIEGRRVSLRFVGSCQNLYQAGLCDKLLPELRSNGIESPAAESTVRETDT